MRENYKHGLRYTKLYAVWKSIKARCLNRLTSHLAREHSVKQDEIIREMYLYSLDKMTP